jgi:predicted RNase H-like HicB family nuclease
VILSTPFASRAHRFLRPTGLLLWETGVPRVALAGVPASLHPRLQRLRPVGAEDSPFWRYDVIMRKEFTAIIERDEEWFIAYSPEVPGANGQGKTKDEALKSLASAIELILEDRRDERL